MQRSWYFRFALMVLTTAAAVIILWPSVDSWVPVPEFVRTHVTRRISPGLDIRGGLRLTYDVDIGEAVRDQRDARSDQIMREMGDRLGLLVQGQSPTREQLAKVAERVTVKSEGERRIRVTFSKPGDLDKLDHQLLTERYRDLREISRKDGVAILEVRADKLEEIQDTAVQQARETIANRVDGLGVREASVTAQNTDIIVEVPGADQEAFDRIREIISKTARLEFQVVDDEATFVNDLNDLPEGVTRQAEVVSAGVSKPQVSSGYLLAQGTEARQKLRSYLDKLKAEGRVPEDHEFTLGEHERVDPKNPRKEGESAWRTYYLFARAEVTGQAIEDAFVATDPQNNKPYVSITFNHDGADLFKQLSGRNVKRRMAIVLDDTVASAPVLQEEIGGGRCQITLGGFRPYNQMLNEAKDLVIVLKAGALPVPIRLSNEQMIGPTLGRDGVEQGVKGALISIVIVLLFMLMYYEVGGAIADVMVLLHIVFQLATQAFFEAALTLPGIVAIALNTGMAIDANVLVNERIREELRSGKTPRVAVEQGFNRAFSSIFDSQITTLIAVIVLFQYGTGPIKGFAISMIFGICTSLFTGIFCSRIAFDWIVRGLRVHKLRIG